MDFREIETKYKADNIKLQDYSALVKTFGDSRLVNVSSYDYYYTNANEDFIRYRAGAQPELTIKRKQSDKNNYFRVELNLKLHPNVTLEEVDKFCELLGFVRNFEIFKTCVIHFFETYNTVFYVVYDTDLKEQARFIEIEMSEHHDWPTEASAWEELVKIEQALKPLGITANHRVKRSLFEMFKK